MSRISTCLYLSLLLIFFLLFPLLLLLLPLLLFGLLLVSPPRGRSGFQSNFGEIAPPAGWAPPFLPRSRLSPARLLTSFGSALGTRGPGLGSFSLLRQGLPCRHWLESLEGSGDQGPLQYHLRSRYLSRVSLRWEGFPWEWSGFLGRGGFSAEKG